MEKEKVYKKIENLATQLSKASNTFTRADLAYELKDYGIQCDSLDIAQLVYEAYEYFGNDENIMRVFVNNEKTQALIKEYSVGRLVDDSDIDGVFSLLDGQSSDILEAFENTTMKITNALQSVSGSNANIIQHISGQAGIVKVKEKATKMHGKYTEFINEYQLSEREVKNLISDFISLRIEIIKIYHEYTNMLIDIFGSSIKKVDPSMFDFDSIKFLDTDSMKKLIELEYEKLTKSCQGIMQHVSKSFSNNLSQSFKSLTSKGDKKHKLALAGLNMLNHYLDAGQKTTELNQELIVFKGKMDHDITIVKGDLGRLQVIHKTINEIHIPKAKIFFKNCKEVFSGEINEFLNSLYKVPGNMVIKQKRDNLLSELKQLEHKIRDNQSNIDDYSRQIDAGNRALNDNRPLYQQALGRKPKRPFFLFNLMTFGMLNKTYNRSVYEWREECLPVVNMYKELSVDLKLNSDELAVHESALVSNKELHQDLTKQVSDLTSMLCSDLEGFTKEKQELGKSLHSIFTLLHLAKEIIGSDIDEKLLEVVSVNKFEEIELPAIIKDSLNNYIDKLKQDERLNLTAESAETSTGINEIRDENHEKSQLMQKKTAVLKSKANTAVNNTVELAKAIAQLKKMQINNGLAKAAYEKELKKILAGFKENISEIDNEAEVLRTALRKINTSEDSAQLKDGLLELTKLSSKNNTREEVEKFLEGKITIEI